MTSPNPSLLIAEDEASLRRILQKLFIQKGWQVFAVPDGEIALDVARAQHIDVVLADIRMPKISGLDLLQKLKSEQRDLPVILMTAQDRLEQALEAMKLGAFDYLKKPFELLEIEILIERALESRRQTEELQKLRKQVDTKAEGELRLVGKSKVLLEIYKTIGRIAHSDAAVMILGESGTGKELLARLIHASSLRAKRPFIAVNCAAIPKDLLESELFGYRRGAFTGADENRIGYFEAANRGTLFLDEIGDLPLELQAKLLRVLQEKEISKLGSTQQIPIDVRIISASHQDITKMIAAKRFREDLFFRLHVVPIHIPPLRARAEDIAELVPYFLEKFAKEWGLAPKQCSAEALGVLAEYAWPGNVRELENTIKRLLLLESGQTIEAQSCKSVLGILPLRLQAQNESLESTLILEIENLTKDAPLNLYEAFLNRVEPILLNWILEQTGGNQIKAAKILGINRNTLRKKLTDYHPIK